ncbi:MAG: hypothetical protein GTO45_03190 [Candidatus Aminicenantes bacterium]|nr:hypothetical protein [Candidatus Aminicenantes bacterium]NIM77731.1 hypothetical protein [Candidatus Aminicenantes bacterium]NIN17044.1 hypothetical protein [Candidatus Aminicenantes bacterium]NIN40937.1 hypothetical protein [Candidatus Aminicenantes bacterium]NIN83742.1 hypothetical protein [Candidatus Aminicenantes bacterium]
MPEPSDLEIPPPKDWQRFERLTCDIFSAEWMTAANMHGREGQPQHGVDIYGQPKGSKEWYGVQCKRKGRLAGCNITADEFRREVMKAKKFTPPLARFILATTGARNATVQQIARQLSQKNQEKGLFSVDVIFWEDFLHMYDRHKEVFRQHYDNLLYKADEGDWIVENLGRNDSIYSDIYSQYENGLNKLLHHMGKNHPKYSEVLLQQGKLLENITKSRRYGDPESRRAERAEIFDQLNRLSLSILGKSFNEICI